MEEIKILIGWIAALKDIGFVGLLIILAVPKFRAFLGFEQNIEDKIAAALKIAFADEDKSPILVKSQIKRICDDVDEIKNHQARMSDDLAYMRGKMDAA